MSGSSSIRKGSQGCGGDARVATDSVCGTKFSLDSAINFGELNLVVHK